MSELKEPNEKHWHEKSCLQTRLPWRVTLPGEVTKVSETINTHWRDVLHCALMCYSVYVTATTIHPHQMSIRKKQTKNFPVSIWNISPALTFTFANSLFLLFVDCWRFLIEWEVCVQRVFRASFCTLKPFWPRRDVVRWRCRYNQDLMKNAASGNLNPREQFCFFSSKWTFCIIFIW